MRTTFAATVAAVVIAVILGAPSSRETAVARAAAPARSASAGKAFAATITYRNTAQGHQQGATTVGIDGNGRFSAKLGPGAKLGAEIVALATGVPLTEIVKGGTYKEQQAAGPHGETGTVVAMFAKRSLGTVCLTYSAKTGTYDPSKGYLPVSGALKVVGGTGAASKWKGGLTFSENGVTGAALEHLLFGGAVAASIGKARPMTAACKRVAALTG